ncbi:MAG TPA: sigma factor-like helix-turn-helix DNA-binding protein [Acidimicrobiales bacterium]|nr:sigma factor-like helix-turn-helix DNA-binding protein [Acidimicrobiales bacterium]
MNEQERARAAELLSHLDERARQIVSLRFALDGSAEPRTLKEVADLLGCSEGAVREEEAAAFATIRRRMTEADS